MVEGVGVFEVSWSLIVLSLQGHEVGVMTKLVMDRFSFVVTQGGDESGDEDTNGADEVTNVRGLKVLVYAA